MLLPVNGKGGAFGIARALAGQCQRKRLIDELHDAGAVKSHPGLHLRKEGFEQALFGAKHQRQGEGERVTRAGKDALFLRINNAVFDFPGFVFGEDRFAINADKRRVVVRNDSHRQRAAVGDAAGKPLWPARFPAGADAGYGVVR